MKTRFLMAILMLATPVVLHAEDFGKCCNVVAIDVRDGTVTLQISGSEKTFTLSVGSQNLLGSIQIGDDLGFHTEDDWDWESLEEGDSLVPTGFEGLDPAYGKDCCKVVDVDFGIEGEAIPARRLADGVTFEVVEMRRVNKNVLHFGFAIDNQTDEVVNPMKYGILGWVGSGPTRIANGVELHDLVGLKYYRAATASESRDLDVAPGTRREYWAQYQAPPEGVDVLTVILSDAPPLYDVPIQ